MQIRIVFHLICLISSSIAIGQLSNIRPAYFQDNYVNLGSKNPSIFKDEQGTELLLQYKSFFGPLSEIRVLYGDLSTIIKKKHKLGFRFQTEQEGDFFQKNRLNLTYGLKVKLSQELDLHASSYLGIVSFNFLPSPADLGGSDTNLDLGLGLSLHTKTFTLGASMNQANRPILQPILDTYLLPRFFTFCAQKKITISENYLIIPQLTYEVSPGFNERVIQTTLLLKEKKRNLYLGTHYFYHLGVSPTAGIVIPYGKTRLGLYFSSFFSFDNSRTVFLRNQYEISMKFQFLRSQKTMQFEDN